MEYPRLYIGGEWVPPRDGGMLDSIDPSTGQTWATVAFGGPRDIDAALWLASDDASFVTGVALPVDGGFTAR
jgi:acyl-CoA reductase-like NAD-dependent aldehyde dehydrogenase